jgi:hypothetical protein
MRASAVVVANEPIENELHVPLVEWDQVIEALVPGSTDQSLPVAIGLGSSHGRLQEAHTEALQGLINTWGEDRVPIVN